MLQEDESVRRDGERYSIGDKVYGTDSSGLGVGYIEKIELLGVGVGFRALVSSIVFDEPKWFDARLLQKEMPEQYQKTYADEYFEQDTQ